MAHIANDYRPTCAGSVITQRKVLTAAHYICSMPTSSISIRTATIEPLTLSSGARQYYVRRVHNHRDYDVSRCSDFQLSDAAILETTRDIMFDDKTQPIEIELNFG